MELDKVIELLESLDPDLGEGQDSRKEVEKAIDIAINIVKDEKARRLRPIDANKLKESIKNSDRLDVHERYSPGSFSHGGITYSIGLKSLMEIIDNAEELTRDDFEKYLKQKEEEH